MQLYAESSRVKQQEEKRKLVTRIESIYPAFLTSKNRAQEDLVLGFPSNDVDILTIWAAFVTIKAYKDSKSGLFYFWLPQH